MGTDAVTDEWVTEPSADEWVTEPPAAPPAEAPQFNAPSVISAGFTRGMLDIPSMPVNLFNAIGNVFLAADQKLADLIHNGPGEREWNAKEGRFQYSDSGPQQRRAELPADFTRQVLVPAISGPEGSTRRKMVGDLSAGQDTALGRISEFAGASVAGGAALGAKSAGALVKEGLTGITAGVGSEGGRKLFPGSKIAPLIGALAGGVAPQIANMHLAKIAARGRDLETIQTNLKTLTDAGISSPTLAIASQRLVNSVAEQGVALIPGGISVMREVSRRIQQQASGAVEKLTGGATDDAFIAGRTVKEGLFGPEGFVANTGRKAKSLYASVDREIPGDTRVHLTNTKALFDEFGQLVETHPELANVLTNPRMQTIARSLNAATPDGTLEYGIFKQVRSHVGDLIGQPELLSTIPKGQLKRLYGAISDDMMAAAESVGPDAVKSVRRANAYYKGRAEWIGNIVEKVNKKATPDEIFNWAVNGNLKDSTKLKTLRLSLKPEEWEIVRGTLLARMGKPPGMAEFSTDTFMTHYGNMVQRSKDVMFSGDKTFNKDMKTLTDAFALINGGPQAFKAFHGTTPTLMTSSIVQQALGGTAVAALTGHPLVAAGITGTIATGMGTAHGAARLMTHPEFVHWAAKATTVPVDRLPAELARLNEAMRDDPQYSDELTEFNLRIAESIAAHGKAAQ